MYVLLQVETKQGLDNLTAIAATEGVDGVFFGPADLSASMGLLGHSTDRPLGPRILLPAARKEKWASSL